MDEFLEQGCTIQSTKHGEEVPEVDIQSNGSPEEACLRMHFVRSPEGPLNQSQNCPRNWTANIFAFFCVMLVVILSNALGYCKFVFLIDTNIMNEATIAALEQFQNEGQGMDIAARNVTTIDAQEEPEDITIKMFSATVGLYSIIGIVSTWLTIDRFGRRFALFMTGVALVGGPTLMATAPNFNRIEIGGAITNAAAGSAVVIAPIYSAEVSPASNRRNFRSRA